MRTLTAIGALGLTLAGCSQIEDPVATYKCGSDSQHVTVIYDSSSSNPAEDRNGGISVCGEHGCRITFKHSVVGEVIQFSIYPQYFVLDRGDSTLRYGDKGVDRGDYKLLNCKVVPNGTR